MLMKRKNAVPLHTCFDSRTRCCTLYSINQLPVRSSVTCHQSHLKQSDICIVHFEVQNTQTWLRKAITQTYNNVLRNIPQVCLSLIFSTKRKTFLSTPYLPNRQTKR